MKSAKKSSLKKSKPKKTAKPARAKKASAGKKAAPSRARKVGVFGGSFDPFHKGHLNSILTVAKACGLAEVRVVPAYQSPLRKLVQGSQPEQRCKMAELGTEEFRDLIKIDDCEIRRGGVSYTIDTLKSYGKAKSKDQLFLIIGMDQFEHFDQWKDFTEILGLCDLVVTSRPGMSLPLSTDSVPGGVRALIKKFAKATAELMNGRKIHFVQLEDVEVSATEIRRRIREHHPVTDLVPTPVAEYIGQKGLYETLAKTIGDFEQFTRQCADLLASKGGINIQAFDLRKVDAPADFTLVASGTSTRHASALAEAITREVKKQLGVWPQGVEGMNEGRWVVLDYGALIIHVFYDFARQEYRLEQLWRNALPLALTIAQPSGARVATETKSPTQPS